MKNSTTTTNAKVSTKVNETKEIDFLKNLDSINFDSLEKKVQIKEKINVKQSSEKKRIYKKTSELSTKEARSFRQKMRTKRERFENNIRLYYNENQNENLKKEIKDFLTHYKEEYILNDFSINSLIENNTDTNKFKTTTEMLNIIKEILLIK